MMNKEHVMLARRLRQLRKERNLTQAELARILAVTQQAVGKWENGHSLPDAGMLVRLRRYFEVSLDFLLGEENYPDRSVNRNRQLIPVIGTVRAGYGSLAFEEDLGLEPAGLQPEEDYFYLLVKGSSMAPRIQEGDLALVRRQAALDDGDLGVIVYGDGEGTIKCFRRKGAAVVLQPFNSAYEPMILTREDLEQLYIVGRVVETRARW
jgi:repressor LexA